MKDRNGVNIYSTAKVQLSECQETWHTGIKRSNLGTDTPRYNTSKETDNNLKGYFI